MKDERDWERLRAATFGFAVGDALGVPYERRARGEYHCTGMTAGRSIPAGTWSDDTAMTLATIDSLRRNRWTLNVEDLTNRLWHWMADGAYTPDGTPFGGSPDTRHGIASARARKHWVSGNDNGALKRMLPFAFTSLDDADLLKAAGITNPDDHTSVTYVHLLRCLMRGGSVRDAVQWVGWKRALNLDEWEVLSSSTYVKDTLRAVIWCAGTSDSYREAVLKAVNLGGDTDTIGALTGGLIAIRDGAGSIPGEWLDGLRGRDVLDGVVRPVSG